MTPEARARQTIDAWLTQAGWHVCDVANANIHAGDSAVKGVAIREFLLNLGHGFADYLLYINGKACGVIGAKKAARSTPTLRALKCCVKLCWLRSLWSAEQPEGRWRTYSFDDIVAHDKASLDIFWLKDDSLADSDNLPAPIVIAQESVEDLQAALEQFKLIAGDLGADVIDAV
jgi:hypothetical protein